MTNRKNKGFSLIELLVVVAIVGILAAVGYPAYTEHAKKSRRVDGQSMLMSVIQAQERYYTENQTYVTDLTLLGYSSSTMDSDEGYYKVKASNCAAPNNALTTCVLITATPQGAQAGDVTLTLDSLGNKSW